jgi:hypothetical protein
VLDEPEGIACFLGSQHLFMFDVQYLLALLKRGLKLSFFLKSLSTFPLSSVHDVLLEANLFKLIVE